MTIVLVGMMGAGKTRVGSLLSKKLQLPFLDSDRLVEKESGKTIPELFFSGEDSFRKVERDIYLSLGHENDRVIAAGGGVVLDPKSWEHVRNLGVSVYLKASPSVLSQRILPDIQSRPLLKGSESVEEKLQELISTRESYYNDADYVIETDDLSIEEVASQILREII